MRPELAEVWRVGLARQSLLGALEGLVFGVGGEDISPESDKTNNDWA